MTASPHITELLPAYALGCLDQPEAERARAHLGECDACRAELEVYEEVVAELMYASRSVAPPPVALKQRILDSLNPSRSVSGPSLRVKTWRDLMSGWSRPQFAFGITALVLIFGLLLANFRLWQRVQALEQQHASVEHIHTVMLMGSEIAPEAHAVLVMPENGEQGALVVDDLPPLDEVHAYQLWLIDENGKRESGGVFTVDATGHATVTVAGPKPLETYKAFGVTVEPLGGSPGPTGPKVLGSA